MKFQHFDWLIQHWPEALKVKNAQGYHCLDLLWTIHPNEAVTYRSLLEKKDLSQTIPFSAHKEAVLQTKNKRI